MTQKFEVDLDAANKRIKKLRQTKSRKFSDLVKAAGLNPKIDFQHRNLNAQDMSGNDLSGFDFSGSDLIGSTFAGAKVSKAHFVQSKIDITALSKAQDWSSTVEKKIRREADLIIEPEIEEDEPEKRSGASFSPVLEETIHRALTLSSDRKHELSTLEHLLLALLDDKDARAVLAACDVRIEPLRQKIINYLDEDLASLIIEDFEESRPTAGFHRVIQRAVIHVQSSGREEITGANALIALFAERESHAVFFLQEQDMTRYDAVNYLSHGISKARTFNQQDLDTELHFSECDSVVKTIIYTSFTYAKAKSAPHEIKDLFGFMLIDEDVQNLFRECDINFKEFVKKIPISWIHIDNQLQIESLTKSQVQNIIFKYLTSETPLDKDLARKLIRSLSNQQNTKFDNSEMPAWFEILKSLRNDNFKELEKMSYQIKTITAPRELSPLMGLAHDLSKYYEYDEINTKHLFLALLHHLPLNIKGYLKSNGLTERKIRQNLNIKR